MTSLSVNALLFDVDDTLYDRQASFTKWADSYIADVLGVTDAIMIRSMFDQFGKFDGSVYGSKKELIEDVMMLYPPPASSNYTAAKAYADFAEDADLSSQAKALLYYLDEVGFPYGIVTNGGPRQVEKVQMLGLRDRAACVFISETFGSAKPDRSIFDAAAKCLGYLPSQILFVGDHPFNDILGAHNAGMKTAWLHNNQPWPEVDELPRPDVMIDLLSDLTPLLRGVDRQPSVV